MRLFTIVPLVLVPLALCAALIVGCKSGDTASSTAGDAATKDVTKKADAAPVNNVATNIAGTWTNVSPEAVKDGAKTDFTFDPDGTYTMTAEVTPPGQKAPFATIVKGTYKLDGDTLNMQITDIEMSSKDPSMKAELDKQNASAKANISKIPPTPGKLAWKDKDNATLTMEPATAGAKGDVYELKRKA
jgi:hypothetical protein